MTYVLSLRNLVQSLTRSSRRDRGSARPGRIGKFTPRMELLEDLTLPSTISWINPMGGDWAVASNWSGGRVPGAADDAVIELAGNYAVTHSTGTDTVRSLTSRREFRMTGGMLTVGSLNSHHDFRMAGGTLTTQAASNFYGAVNMNLGFLTNQAALTMHREVSFIGGTIMGAGNLEIRGFLTWSGGMMTGIGTTHARGGMQFTASGRNGLDGRTLHNYGRVDWWGSGDLVLREGAVFNNEATGLFIVRNEVRVVGDSETRGGVFNNHGTFRVDVGHAHFAREMNHAGVVFNNFNQVRLGGGGMTLRRGGTTRGEVAIAYGQSLLLPAETFVVNAGASFTGEGWVRIQGATVRVNAQVQTRSVELSRGMLDAAGTVRMGGLFAWSGGEVLASGGVRAEAGMAITGSADKVFRDGALHHTGMAVWTGTGSLIFDGRDGTATFTNSAGSTFDVRTDATLAFGGANSGFVNHGRFQKTSGSTSMFVGGMDNFGTVAVNAGRLEVIGGIINHNLADIQVAAGTTLSLDSLNAYVGSRVQGAGNVSFASLISYVEGTYNITGHTHVMGGVVFYATANTGSLHNQGLVIAAQGSSLTVMGDYVQENYAGTYIDGVIVTIGGLMDIWGGGLAGHGTINGNVQNAGRLSIGDDDGIGRLNINGNYIQTADGVLDLEIGSAAQGFDQLRVSGTATLDGIVNINVVEGFAANLDDDYRILTFTERVGGFSTINSPYIGDTMRFDSIYDAGGLSLRIVEIVP